MNAFAALKPERDNISYSIVFGYVIEHEILEVENPREYVEEGILSIDVPGNVLTYGNEKSVIVNVSARSVKALYELYSYRGLFSQNLWYYVKNAKVDDNIILSMQEKPDNFWYYNNGIIIICDSYEVVGQELRVKNFSIINGGQTTKLIGETDFETDFYVQCKLVKNKYSEQEERLDFIAAVAEASNTQKPIKDKDHIANKTEQRLLKKQLADAGIWANASLLHLNMEEIEKFICMIPDILQDNGILYFSLKSGITTGMDTDGRFFTDASEEKYSICLEKVQQLKLLTCGKQKIN